MDEERERGAKVLQRIQYNNATRVCDLGLENLIPDSFLVEL